MFTKISQDIETRKVLYKYYKINSEAHKLL